MGVSAACAICGLLKPTIPLSVIADMVDDVFKKYVYYGQPAPGEPLPYQADLSTPNEIIHYEILQCESEDLVDVIVGLLHDKHEYGVLHDGDTPMYESDSSMYQRGVLYTEAYTDEWERFVEGVKHRGRFYLSEEREYLERIFRPLLKGDLHQGGPPVVVLGGEGSEIREIYRARIANTPSEQRRILENPARELAPPPPTLRTAGRMNAAGVVAFYGAADVTTCIAELAVPFGGAAIVGRFEFLRPVRVLDLRLLSRSSLAVSALDPEYGEKVNYSRFMQQLRNLLREPVMPGSETLDYLPTQMIAEFFANEGLDGVMFVSSVTPEAEREAREEAHSESLGVEAAADIARTTGLNIVLFAHAAIVINDMGPPIRRVLRVQPLIEFKPPFKNWWYVEVAEDGPLPEDREPLPYPTFYDAIEPTLQLAENGVLLALPKSIEYRVATAEPTFSPVKDKTSNGS